MQTSSRALVTHHSKGEWKIEPNNKSLSYPYKPLRQSALAYIVRISFYSINILINWFDTKIPNLKITRPKTPLSKKTFWVRFIYKFLLKAEKNYEDHEEKNLKIDEFLHKYILNNYLKNLENAWITPSFSVFEKLVLNLQTTHRANPLVFGNWETHDDSSRLHAVSTFLDTEKSLWNLHLYVKVSELFQRKKWRINGNNWISITLKNSSEQSNRRIAGHGSFKSPNPMFPLLLLKPAKRSKTEKYLFLYIKTIWTFVPKNYRKRAK